MNEEELKKRTKQLALRIIRVVEALPNTRSAQKIGRKLLQSATSIGANYRAACRAKSTADMISKLQIVTTAADKTLYWLELIGEANLITKNRLTGVKKETNEILAIMISSIKTLQRRKSWLYATLWVRI